MSEDTIDSGIGYFIYDNKTAVNILVPLTWKTADWQNLPYKHLEIITNSDIHETVQGANVEVKVTLKPNSKFGWVTGRGMTAPSEGALR